MGLQVGDDGGLVRGQGTRDDLGAVPDAIRLARGTLAVIRGNLAWAFGYNIAAIPLAAAGFLNPLIAGAAMALSSAFVVGNSVRLRHYAAHAPARRNGARPEPVSQDRLATGPPDTPAAERETAESPAQLA